ncbi:MAG: threo-3-hydroxy-L-aspartate ammonia-lyase [Leptolyngbya sp. SIO1E4]|nr:threo-3-hydroxy-L-aspartate ammonia-lyase [Leptolyngbya sp. SIO1E4]
MIEQILAAATRLYHKAHVTPIASSSTLNKMLGAEVFFKCENFQKIGAFKFRGAYNAIAQLSQTDLNRGVIAYSSGNHAQAVARVGQDLGVKTVIVMPTNAPQAKRFATQGYGAEVVLYDPEQATREDIAGGLQAKHGYTLIPPFNHPQVIAGQGTVALELLREVRVDSLLVPCGGGGLLSGCAIAAKHLNPACKVIGIEPEMADDATHSFRSGELQHVKNPPTIADGTRTASLGSLTFPLVLEHVDDMQTVSETAIMKAMEFLFYRMKLVVEPSGALGLAALLSGAVKVDGKVGVILSGGNVDAATLGHILASAAAA